MHRRSDKEQTSDRREKGIWLKNGLSVDGEREAGKEHVLWVAEGTPNQVTGRSFAIPVCL